MSTFEEAVQDIKKAKSVLENQPADVADVVKHPDPTKHKYISFVKSGFRILAGVALCLTLTPLLWYAGALLIVAELLGIAEELV
jgi:hypothetical protein